MKGKNGDAVETTTSTTTKSTDPCEGGGGSGGGPSVLPSVPVPVQVLEKNVEEKKVEGIIIKETSQTQSDLSTVPSGGSSSTASSASSGSSGYGSSIIAVTEPFVRILIPGSVGRDVRLLQIFLNTQGFTVSKSGAGSVGKETTFFGPLTRRALIRFQDAHADDILKPLNLKKGTGYLHEATIKFMNELIEKNK